MFPRQLRYCRRRPPPRDAGNVAGLYRECAHRACHAGSRASSPGARCTRGARGEPDDLGRQQTGAARDTIEAEWTVARGFTTIGVWYTVHQVLQAGSRVRPRHRRQSMDQSPPADERRLRDASTVPGPESVVRTGDTGRINWREVDPARLGRLATTVSILPRLDPE